MSDRFEGLTVDAEDFLSKNGVEADRGLSALRPERIGSFFGSSMGIHPLFRYTLKNGEFALEFLQVARPSSEGMVFYLGLRTLDRVFWWDDLP